ncbi:carboxypeptidase-like regulatory domain-containing protein [Hyunsoonleella flava]|uniref:carboxypeptidase-like regulatory domain-containing protein n=1 Tax=Hyunsoonleella flava TaxID=2527939 RepID=UPI001F409A44|nr:carboxypeptidase-like regulatory domain-containing protein [Hyunsoonleella flava]
MENIHVINKTAQKFTITNASGEFIIPARLNDTLRFSSVQHKLKDVLITQEIITSKTVTVILEEKINALNQVTVGKILTGDLSSDIGTVKGETPINFYDVGIPGYTGKIATQSERRLAEAGEFKPKMLLGALTGSIPLNPILNGISGRTKMLKKRVKHERNEALITKLRQEFSESLFSIYPLSEEFRADFFYFCEMDENFYQTCNGKSDLEVLEFLKHKLKQYKANQQED